MKYKGFLFAVLALALALAHSAAAQTLRDSLFAEADRAFAAAREANAELLAPRSYERGQKAYASAEQGLERGRNVEYIRSRLADATARFEEAAQAATLTRTTLAATASAPPRCARRRAS